MGLTRNRRRARARAWLHQTCQGHHSIDPQGLLGRDGHRRRAACRRAPGTVEYGPNPGQAPQPAAVPCALFQLLTKLASCGRSHILQATELSSLQEQEKQILDRIKDREQRRALPTAAGAFSPWPGLALPHTNPETCAFMRWWVMRRCRGRIPSGGWRDGTRAPHSPRRDDAVRRRGRASAGPLADDAAATASSNGGGGSATGLGKARDRVPGPRRRQPWWPRQCAACPRRDAAASSAAGSDAALVAARPRRPRPRQETGA